MKLIAMRVAVAVLAWASAAMAASPGNAPQLPVTGARIINVATEPQLQTAMSNLQSEAAARGVDGNRLIFAPKVPLIEDHFARHRAADLFLDTLPYNAHSTASDALWMGLPVLTCYGRSFTGRVASSVLRAAGLPELVTGSIAEYETLALKLATDRAALEAIRTRLAAGRDQCVLFNTHRFRRHIEAAYATMWERAQRGAPPECFSIDPIAAGEN